MLYKIEVFTKKPFKDSHGHHVYSDIKELGVKKVKSVEYSHVYLIEGDVALKNILNISEKLLLDPVCESYKINVPLNEGGKKSVKGEYIVYVWFKTGVTDTVAESVLKAVRDIGINEDISVKTGQKYIIKTSGPKKKVENAVNRLLVNTIIQKYEIN